MNTTMMLFLNGLLALATISALAGLTRAALQFEDTKRTETVHPSQPVPLRVLAAEDEERLLAEVA